jgi:hypothetical protein
MDSNPRSPGYGGARCRGVQLDQAIARHPEGRDVLDARPRVIAKGRSAPEETMFDAIGREEGAIGRSIEQFADCALDAARSLAHRYPGLGRGAGWAARRFRAPTVSSSRIRPAACCAPRRAASSCSSSAVSLWRSSRILAITASSALALAVRPVGHGGRASVGPHRPQAHVYHRLRLRRRVRLRLLCDAGYESAGIDLHRRRTVGVADHDDVRSRGCFDRRIVLPPAAL